MHQVTAQRCPSYAADLVAFRTSDPQRRPLRSASTRAAIVYNRQVGLLNCDDVCGPDIWNSLPPSLPTITFHLAFRRALETHFYKLAFSP